MQQPTKHPVGLLNLGNTCYINTLLQCLHSCKYLRKFLSKTTHDQSDLFTSLKTLFDHMENITTNIISPRTFLSTANAHLGKLMPLFEQNDISEFHSLLIDKLNTSISHVAPELTQEQFLDRLTYDVTNQYNRLRYRMDLQWYNHLRKEKSKLCPFIYGQTITQINCAHCQKNHHNGELFTSMALAIPNRPPQDNTPITLQDCFEKHFEAHVVNTPNDSDKWTCDGCKQQAQSVQVSFMWKAPPILAISLKRFNFTPQPSKNNTPVKAPIDIDLHKYIISTESSTKYRLRAVAMHYGNFFGGHYVAMVYKKQKWFFIDDDAVKEVETAPEDMIATRGYMFFYERVASANLKRSDE